MGYQVEISVACERCKIRMTETGFGVSSRNLPDPYFALKRRMKKEGWIVRSMGWGTPQTYCRSCSDLPVVPACSSNHTQSTQDAS